MSHLKEICVIFLARCLLTSGFFSSTIYIKTLLVAFILQNLQDYSSLYNIQKNVSQHHHIPKGLKKLTKSHSLGNFLSPILSIASFLSTFQTFLLFSSSLNVENLHLIWCQYFAIFSHVQSPASCILWNKTFSSMFSPLHTVQNLQLQNTLWCLLCFNVTIWWTYFQTFIACRWSYHSTFKYKGSQKIYNIILLILYKILGITFFQKLY